RQVIRLKAPGPRVEQQHLQAIGDQTQVPAKMHQRRHRIRPQHVAERWIIDAEGRVHERLAFGPRACSPIGVALLISEGVDLAHVEGVLYFKMLPNLGKPYERSPIHQTAQGGPDDQWNSIGSSKSRFFL